MDRYLDEVRDFSVAICDASRRDDVVRVIANPSKNSWFGLQGDIVSYLAAAHVFRWEETGDEEQLVIARDYLRAPSPAMAFGANAFWHAITGLRRAHYLTDADEDHLRRAAVAVMRGAKEGHYTRTPGFRIFNHAVTTASLGDVTARLWPEAPESDLIAAESEEVWQEWWTLGENIEGAPNYEGFAQCHILHWGERRGELDRVVNDPRTLAWMDRGIEHIPPIGFIPGFGDSHSTELWSDWYCQMALIASWAPDGGGTVPNRRERAKWVAERVFRWVADHHWLERNLTLTSREYGKNATYARRAWWHVAWMAYYLSEGRHMLLTRAADVRPEPPPILPVVTHRTMPTHDLIRNESWSLIPPAAGQRTPDKGLLRLGSKPESPFCMLSLARQYWHDHMDIGAIDHYSSGRSILLDDNGYDQKLPLNHNLFFAAREKEPWLGYQPGDWARKRAKVASFGPCDYQVRGLTGRNVAQMIVAECRGPAEMPIYHERTVLLARTGELVVRDRVRPYADDIVGAPIWHTQHVRERDSRDGVAWAVTSITDFAGGNGMEADQPEARLLIVSPFDGEPFEVLDQTKPEHAVRPEMDVDTAGNTMLLQKAHVTHQCLFQRRHLDREGTNAVLSLLMPDAAWDRAARATPATPWHSAPDACVVDVNGRLLVFNDGVETLSGAWGSTDAANLWADGSGVFSHRAKRIELRREGVARIGVRSADMPLDLDLTVDGSVVCGHIAAEKPSRVTISTAGREWTVDVFGIVPIVVS